MRAPLGRLTEVANTGSQRSQRSQRVLGRALAASAILAAALLLAGPLQAQSETPGSHGAPSAAPAHAPAGEHGAPSTTATPAAPTVHGPGAAGEPKTEPGVHSETGTHGEKEHDTGEPAAAGHAAEGGHGDGGHVEGGHGEKHEEGGVDIHLKTWLTGPLKQFWYSGPAEVSASGAVYADNPTEPIDPATLNGKSFTYKYEDHHVVSEVKPTYTTTAKLSVSGKQIPGGPAKTEEVEIDGRRVLLVNPAAKFEREGMLPEGLVISLITAVLVALGMFVMTRNLTRIPGKRQMLAEMIYGFFDTFVSDLIGPGYKRYVPLIAAAFIYIFMMNWGAVVPGWAAATANVNVTAGLAIVVVIYVQFVGIRANGFKGYAMHFVGEPWWLFGLNIPIHITGELAKVMSLTIRLFGNIFGEDVVIIILMFLAALFTKGWVPFQLPMYLLVFFTSLVQAMVFSILTCVYIALMTAHHGDESHDAEHHDEHGHDHGRGHGHSHDTAPAVAA